MLDWLNKNNEKFAKTLMIRYLPTLKANNDNKEKVKQGKRIWIQKKLYKKKILLEKVYHKLVALHRLSIMCKTWRLPLVLMLKAALQ